MSLLLILAQMGCVDGQPFWADDGVDCNVVCDADGDRFRSATCAQDFPQCGAEFIGTDCVDSQAGQHPGAIEVCNGLDDNCDGVVDNNEECYDEDGNPTWGTGDNNDDDTGVIPVDDTAIDSGLESLCEGDETAWYYDGDNDTFGAGEAFCAEDAPNRYVDNDNDCDDEDELVAPSREWFDDSDEDGFGNVMKLTQACEEPNDGMVYVERPADAPIEFDCDDSDADVNPDADEYCDEVDSDCDGVVDNDYALDADVWFEDGDGDGFGNPEVDTSSCEQPTDFVSDDQDCDDSDADVNPDVDEVCDSADNDCDGDTDEDDATDATTWYADDDEDGFGDLDDSTNACDVPSGYVDDDQDCDDTDADVNPGETEVTGDEVDQDCDGLETCYLDADGDGYTDGSTIESADEDCDDVSEVDGTNYDAGDEDCDDGEEDANPGETEVCDEIDNNCDGDVDEGVETTFYRDADSDGEGNSSSTSDACSQPSGYVTNDDDCDDGDSAINTSATEVCDSADNDCDGTVDNNAVDADTWYYDGDSDGYGTSSTTTDACDQPSTYVDNDEDCDDGKDDVSPDGTEDCDNGDDDDCDGDTDEDDSDCDEESSSSSSSSSSTDFEADCVADGDCEVTINCTVSGSLLTVVMTVDSSVTDFDTITTTSIGDEPDNVAVELVDGSESSSKAYASSVTWSGVTADDFLVEFSLTDGTTAHLSEDAVEVSGDCTATESGSEFIGTPSGS